MKNKAPQRIVIYMDVGFGWRWRAVATNGKIVADGAEGYKTKGNATRAAERFVDSIVSYGARIVYAD